MQEKYKKQIKELMYMRALDQEVRTSDHDFDNPSDIDKRNTDKLKKIIDDIGWPTRPKVGKEASDSAWLIAQHADLDPEFQEKCLRLMKEVSEDVSKSNIAYLEDRVTVSKGEPQLYGTQFKKEEGDLIPEEIEDAEKLDERREEMGLQPFEEYKKMMQHVNK